MSENRKSTSNVMLVSKKSQIKSMINALYIHQDSLGTNSILIQISDQKIQILHTQQQSDPKINIQEIKEKEKPLLCSIKIFKACSNMNWSFYFLTLVQ